MHIRNRLEDFHVEHVPDTVMPELNSAIRYAIHEYLTELESADLGWLAIMVPDYWEIPGLDEKPTFTGEYLWEGKPVPRTEHGHAR